MKKGVLVLAVGLAGGYVLGKYGKEIVEKVKLHANNESFEQLLKELEKQSANLFEKETLVSELAEGTVYSRVDTDNSYSNNVESEVLTEPDEDDKYE